MPLAATKSNEGRPYVIPSLSSIVSCGVAISSCDLLRVCTLVLLVDNFVDSIIMMEVCILQSAICVFAYLPGLNFIYCLEGTKRALSLNITGVRSKLLWAVIQEAILYIWTDAIRLRLSWTFRGPVAVQVSHNHSILC